MPVTTRHADYDANLKYWTRCRDFYEGSDKVKAAGELYLPRLELQTDEEYQAYVDRALFYNATARTVAGLAGFVFRKEPEVKAPESIAEDLRDITMTGVSFTSFCRTLLNELLVTGRYGVMVDMAPAAEKPERPYWIGFRAEQITNWATRRRGGDTILSMVVLAESAEEPDPADPFMADAIEQYRVLKLDESGLYVMELWRWQSGDREGEGSWVIHDLIVPTRFGRRLDFIPFQFFGPSSADSMVAEKPPLLDLVDVNLSHYRSSADLEHGRHFTALPTPWVAGFPEETVLKIGSTVAWVSSNPDAKVGMLEFTGQGLGALERALTDKEGKMGALGARLLKEQSTFPEAENTVKLRQAGEHSILQALANTQSAGLTKALSWYAEWRGAGTDVAVKLNTDYFPDGMSPELVRELTATWIAGGISWPTFYQALKDGEMTRPGVTAEEERAAIEADMPGARLLNRNQQTEQEREEPASSRTEAGDAQDGPRDTESEQVQKVEIELSETVTDRLDALADSAEDLRRRLDEDPAGQRRFDEMLALLAQLLGRPQQAPVVNATIVLPADEATPLVRTVERDANGLITKITEKPAERPA